MLIYLKYFVAGAATAFLITFTANCSKDGPTKPKDNIDPKLEEINESVKDIIQAFKSGNVVQVQSALTDKAAERFGDKLEGVKEKFPGFASALEEKELIIFTEFYAEYSIEIEGKKYIIAFSKPYEGSDWKLVKM